MLSNITLVMTVLNVDYAVILTLPPVLQRFRESIQSAIADYSGEGVENEHVALSLSAGSVTVRATISPPGGAVGRDAALYRLRFSSARQDLAEAIVAALQQMEGIEQVVTGSVAVSRISVDGDDLDVVVGGSSSTRPIPVNGAPVDGAPVDGGNNPATLSLAVVASLVGGMLCMCCLQRMRVARHSTRGEHDKAAASGFPEALGAWMWPLGCFWGGEAPRVPRKSPPSWV